MFCINPNIISASLKDPEYRDRYTVEQISITQIVAYSKGVKDSKVININDE